MSKSSVVTIDPPTVVKRVVKYLNLDVFRNEVRWLTLMEDFDRVPNIIDFNKKKHWIKMTYVGKPIIKKTIPDDWKDQMKVILSRLLDYGCCHNDIKPTDILVLDKKLHLVDFGWATSVGDIIPKSWPKRLGSKYKLGLHNFDDNHSFELSIKETLG